MMIPEIARCGYSISKIIGSSTCYKRIVINNFNLVDDDNDEVELSFIDAMSFVTPQTLKEFVKNFGVNDKEDMKKEHLLMKLII